jgi:hypothetical protein
MFPTNRRMVMGNVTGLVCFAAFHEASRTLEKAQLRYRVASYALAAVRERLSQALDRAYQHQSFGPLSVLFDEEEAALATYERAGAKLAEAEERWCALRVALAYEKDLMRVGPLPRQRLN